MAPKILGRAEPSQGAQNTPSFEHTGTYAAFGLALVAIFILLLLILWRDCWYVNPRDEELGKLQVSDRQLSRFVSNYDAAQNQSRRLHELLAQEREASDLLRRDAAEAMAKLTFAEQRAASLSRRVRILTGETPHSPAAPEPTGCSPPVRGLGIMQPPNPSEVGPNPTLAAFCARILGKSPTPASAAAPDAAKRRAAGRPELTVDTAAASQATPVGTPASLRGQPVAEVTPGLARRTTADALVAVKPEGARKSMRAEFGTATPPPLSPLPRARRPRQTLADELAGVGADPSCFESDFDDEGEDEEPGNDRDLPASPGLSTPRAASKPFTVSPVSPPPDIQTAPSASPTGAHGKAFLRQTKGPDNYQFSCLQHAVRVSF